MTTEQLDPFWLGISVGILGVVVCQWPMGSGRAFFTLILDAFFKTYYQ